MRPEVDIFAENALEARRAHRRDPRREAAGPALGLPEDQAEAGLRLAARRRGRRVARRRRRREGRADRDRLRGARAVAREGGRGARRGEEDRRGARGEGRRGRARGRDARSARTPTSCPIVAAVVRRTLLGVGRPPGRDGGARMSAPTRLRRRRTPSPSTRRSAAATSARRRCSSRRATGTSTRASTRRPPPPTGACRSWDPSGPDGQPACLDDCRAGRALLRGRRLSGRRVRVSGVLLAAGASTRFGSPKMLAPVRPKGGNPMLAQVIETWRDAGFDGDRRRARWRRAEIRERTEERFLR